MLAALRQKQHFFILPIMHDYAAMRYLRSFDWRRHVMAGIFPLMTGALLTVFAGLMYGTNFGYDIDSLIVWLKHLFATYGLWALFGAAFVEGIYMVSLYFPGSLVIIAAVLFSSKTLPDLAVITAICWVAFMMATVLNYALGAGGFYRLFNWLGAEKMLHSTHRWLQKNGWWAMLLTAFHPSYLGISSVCMGIGREGLGKTLLLAGGSMLISGPILVGGTAAVTETMVSESDNLFYLMIALFYLWAFYLVGKSVYAEWRRRRLAEAAGEAEPLAEAA